MGALVPTVILVWGGRIAAALALAYAVKKWVWPVAKGIHDAFVSKDEEIQQQKDRGDIWKQFLDLNRRLDATKESSDSTNRRLAIVEGQQDSMGREVRGIAKLVEAHGRRLANIEKVHEMCPRAADMAAEEERIG